MTNLFIKVYEEGEESGYMSARDIYWIEVVENTDDYGARYFQVMGSEKEEDIRDGWVLSDTFSKIEKAEKYLDDLVKKLNRFSSAA